MGTMTNTILDRYGRRFSSQEPRETRLVEVITNPIVDEVCRRYEKWIQKTGIGEAYECIKDIEYSSKDIREFSLRLKDYQHHGFYFTRSGLFLSALINKCEDGEYEILTNHLDLELDLIGTENSKKIIVKGNVGDNLGENMKSGKIIVEGDAGFGVASSMKSGTIHITGNSGMVLGFFIKQGEIFVDGEMNEFSDEWNGGRLYHKGVLVRGKK